MSWPQTEWDRVLALRDPAAREQALQDVCRLYRGAVLAFCRRWNDQEAEDLAHDFFLWVIEKGKLEMADPAKGRFRSYVCTLLFHFLCKHRRAGQTQKRGGGAEHVELDENVAFVDAASGVLFDRAWADETMKRVIAALRSESVGSGLKEEVLAALLPALQMDDKGTLSWSALAERTGLPAGTLRSHASRLRQRFRELLEREVAETASGPDLEAEMRYLMRVLMGP